MRYLDLNSREFLRIGNETNGLNMPCLHFNSQHEKSLTTGTGADDYSRLTIDFRQFHISMKELILRKKGT